MSPDLTQKIDMKLLALERVIKNFSESPHNHMDWAFVANVQNINHHIDYVLEELNDAFEYTNNVPKRYFDAFKGLQVRLKSVLEEEILKISDESVVRYLMSSTSRLVDVMSQLHEIFYGDPEEAGKKLKTLFEQGQVLRAYQHAEKEEKKMLPALKDAFVFTGPSTALVEVVGSRDELVHRATASALETMSEESLRRAAHVVMVTHESAFSAQCEVETMAVSLVGTLRIYEKSLKVSADMLRVVQEKLGEIVSQFLVYESLVSPDLASDVKANLAGILSEKLADFANSALRKASSKGLNDQVISLIRTASLIGINPAAAEDKPRGGIGLEVAFPA
jgi:vesicle coat complex subunit